MPRAVDHLVIAARDLPEQAALYRRLGFQVGARNRHSWGTENHVVQFDGAFLELIGLGDEFAAPHPSEAVYPFAGFLARYLGRREGLAMMVMRSADAEADRRGFDAAGIGGFARFDFARKGRRPDGGEVEVAFSLAFAASPALPETGFFVCQQHFPENFWSRAAQIHPNGALGVAGLTLVCDEPDRAGSSSPPSSLRRRKQSPAASPSSPTERGSNASRLRPIPRSTARRRQGRAWRRCASRSPTSTRRRSGSTRPASGLRAESGSWQ